MSKVSLDGKAYGGAWLGKPPGYRYVTLCIKFSLTKPLNVTYVSSARLTYVSR